MYDELTLANCLDWTQAHYLIKNIFDSFSYSTHFLATES